MKIPLLINMKMPTIVGIIIFISRENVMRSCVEHKKKKFYNLVTNFANVRQAEKKNNVIGQVPQVGT